MPIGRIRKQQLHPDYRPDVNPTIPGIGAIVDEVEPVDQEVGGIWFNTKDTVTYGTSVLIIGNAIVSDDDPGPGYKIWYDIEE